LNSTRFLATTAAEHGLAFHYISSDWIARLSGRKSKAFMT
jgi:hypothetical protein